MTPGFYFRMKLREVHVWSSSFLLVYLAAIIEVATSCCLNLNCTTLCDLANGSFVHRNVNQPHKNVLTKHIKRHALSQHQLKDVKQIFGLYLLRSLLFLCLVSTISKLQSSTPFDFGIWIFCYKFFTPFL